MTSGIQPRRSRARPPRPIEDLTQAKRLRDMELLLLTLRDEISLLNLSPEEKERPERLMGKLLVMAHHARRG